MQIIYLCKTIKIYIINVNFSQTIVNYTKEDPDQT